uniref:Putative secreted protein n=1 Tax=Xenopsylla cheopis TaxID=163159 RepID=A0A6M2DVL5_XENCH
MLFIFVLRWATAFCNLSLALLIDFCVVSLFTSLAGNPRKPMLVLTVFGSEGFNCDKILFSTAEDNCYSN